MFLLTSFLCYKSKEEGGEHQRCRPLPPLLIIDFQTLFPLRTTKRNRRPPPTKTLCPPLTSKALCFHVAIVWVVRSPHCRITSTHRR